MKGLVKSAIPRLANQLVSASDEEMSEILMSFRNNCAVILPYQQAHTMVNMFRGVRKSHIMKQNLVPGFSTYFFKKNSPYISIFHEMIARHLQYGITSFSFEYWRNEINKKETSENLSFSHLRVIFIAISLGWILSLFLFILEKSIDSICTVCSSNVRKS